MRLAPPPSCLPSHHAGLTLIELLVTVAVLAIMATIGIPNYQRLSARSEVASEVMRLKTALALTRNAAITRRSTITLCPSTDGSQCTITNNADGKAWLAPLAIFEGRGEAGDTLLRTLGESRLVSLTYRNDNRPVRYTALGRSGGHNGTFRLCGRLETGAKVVVSNMGRVRSEASTPANCSGSYSASL